MAGMPRSQSDEEIWSRLASGREPLVGEVGGGVLIGQGLGEFTSKEEEEVGFVAVVIASVFIIIDT
jgi:hypothetical protein